MSTTFPHFCYPLKKHGVGRRFLRGKLSTVIPTRFALCGQPASQKNFYPTYPRAAGLFPPGYPRNHPHGKSNVEKPVENRGITTEKRAQ
ncbi:hypothetical protein ACFP2F_02965 [Hymenobacter artigasi]|uniref:Uncharacterized protein n=1 Tax=Hymenobacter artigasi TaxID=2719616 RepID=A0ABX1HDQ6_9BACT|nr:hypothetical protein [Hymenobacter artigasi]NKI88015.1 hypothetical protein [Hymenobacter artigasi]